MSAFEDIKSNDTNLDETAKLETNVPDFANDTSGEDQENGAEFAIETSNLQSMVPPLVHQNKSIITGEGHVMNPQDATLHSEQTTTADFPVTIHNDGASLEDSPVVVESSIPMEIIEQQHGVAKIEVVNEKSDHVKVKRKVHKRSRVATISTKNEIDRSLPTPSNHYECWLVRRAILPLSAGKAVAPEQMEDQFGYSIYGDTALGMKLSIADTGQVIVQRVTPLLDGRASPAQLTGCIQRGDVLIAIDGVCLTENNTLAGLKPLQAPDDPNVPCQRRYKLRLASGAGLEVLICIEEQQSKVDADSLMGPPSNILGLFPMVDQLSGIPLFEAQSGKENEVAVTVTVTDPLPINSDLPMEPPSRKMKNSIELDSHISEQLASQRYVDKHQLLGSDGQTTLDKQVNQKFTQLSLPERQNQGRKAIIGAMNLLKQVENIDAGKDVRSFQSWNTTLSLYSRASVRRRRVFDAASLPSKNFGRVVEHIEEKEEDDSIESGRSNADSNDIDGDELLLRLAAHDEIWRTQVIEFLEDVALNLDTPHNSNEETEKATPQDINAAMSKELGDFLFGENMAKILSTNRTPRALPSEEVTAVLFDLATKLSASVPDEIKAAGTIISSKSELTPFQEIKRNGASDTDVSLASHFLLDNALPVWLKSFRPLTWENRRILWPVNTVHIGGSTASTLSDDGLTVDTTNVSLHSTITRHHRRKKSIQEIIEDQELDIETRGEAYVSIVPSYILVSLCFPDLLTRSLLLQMFSSYILFYPRTASTFNGFH